MKDHTAIPVRILLAMSTIGITKSEDIICYYKHLLSNKKIKRNSRHLYTTLLLLLQVVDITFLTLTSVGNLSISLRVPILIANSIECKCLHFICQPLKELSGHVQYSITSGLNLTK